MATALRVVCSALALAVIVPLLLGLVIKGEARSKIVRVSLFTFIQLLLGTGSCYVWTKIRSIFPDTQLSKLSKWAMLIFALTGHSFIISHVFLVGENPHWFSITSFTCLGFYIHFLICFSFVSFLNWLRGSNSILPRTILFISIFYSMNVGLVGLYAVSGMPEVRNINVSLNRLPPSMAGFKIVQICDIHLGPTVGRNRLEGIVDLVNSLDGDLVVINGDLVDHPVDKLYLAAEPLRRLQSRYGTYYVTGNHEYYIGGVDEWFDKLRELGVKILHNDHVEIHSRQNPDEFFYLAGVDDLEASVIHYKGHGMDIDKAMSSCEKDKAVVLLAHQPWSAKIALNSNHNIDLVLSGHTHGGQWFPLTVVSYLTMPFYLGLYEYKGSLVYVAEGTAFWGIPMRIGTSMEITRVTLHH